MIQASPDCNHKNPCNGEAREELTADQEEAR